MANGTGGGQDTLEKRYNHLDQRVGELAQAMARQAATQESMRDTLDSIAKRVNTPQTTQWGWIIAAIGAGATGTMFVMMLAISPIEKGLVEVTREHSQLHAEVTSRGPLLGAVEARLDRAEAELAEDDQTFGKVMQLLNRVDRRMGYIEGRMNGK